MTRNYRAEREKEQERRDKEIAAVKTFFEFLRGNIPEGISVARIKKMNAKQAFSVIWFLQEVCHLLPDQYEMCRDCELVYNAHREGRYIETTGRCYCGDCGPEEQECP
jgi:hypothetical protein